MGGGVCAVAMNQDLFFEFTAPSAGDYQIDTFGSFFDTKLAVYSGAGCSATCLAYDDDANSTLQSQVDIAGVNAGDVLLIQVGGFNAAASGNGDLNIGPSMSPCLVPDMFEENDDCPSAFPIGDGTYSDLDVHTDDNDFYAVTIAAGASMTADILFLDVIADLDLYLWDPSVACDTNILGTGAMTGWLVRGYSANDNESITYTNTTGSSQNLILEVDMFTGGGACNSYDLIVSGTSGSGTGNIGTNYCTAVANSSGAPGTMSAKGSTAAAANNLTLEASSLPNNQFGIFVTSLTQGFVPGAGGTSNGNLCLGGALGRFSQPSQILNTGSNGSFDLVVDTTMMPQGSGFVTIMPGDTWSFQAWHRDPVGVGSNFTDGLEISFN